MRVFRTFSHKDASYRISIFPGGPDTFGAPGDAGRTGAVPGADEWEKIYGLISRSITGLRRELEDYIKQQPLFLSSLVPVELLPGAPRTAELMAEAAFKTGLGPMAAVAGTIAQLAAEQSADAAAGAGFRGIIIENGGDIFICPAGGQLHGGGPMSPVIAGIFSGPGSQFGDLALKIPLETAPLGVCSSSGVMGHSLSLGSCDLSTAVSKSAPLADAAATLGGNLVKTENDLEPAAEKLASIPGIEGVLLIKNGRMALAGHLPELIRHSDRSSLDKITGTVIIS